MTASKPTLITLVISSILAPWLASRGLNLSPEQVAWLSTAAVTVCTGIAHLIHVRAANGRAPTVPPAAIVLALLLPAFVLVAGCATLKSASGQALLQASVDAAVGTAVQTAGSPANQAQRANQIATIAGDLQGIVKDDNVTLAALQAALETAIDAAKLNPDDKLAIDLVATTLGGILQQELTPGTGPLSAADVADIVQVLGWVRQAANVYTAQMRAARLGT